MASVYSAYDTQLERIVALKMLRAELELEEVRARMLREAQAMARLKHPHVVTVYEVGTFENRIYIARSSSTARPFPSGAKSHDRGASS